MDTDKFIETVKRMRQAQKDYFKYRDQRVLIHAKMLENVVDTMIQQYDDFKLKHPVQRNLFDEF